MGLAPRRPWHADTVGWSLSGAGVALAGVGIGYFVSAGNLTDDARRELSQDRRQGLRDQAESRKTLATVLTLGGAAVLSAGIVKLVLTDNPRDGSISVAIFPNGIGIGGRF